jgi:hypothetical protein
MKAVAWTSVRDNGDEVTFIRADIRRGDVTRVAIYVRGDSSNRCGVAFDNGRDGRVDMQIGIRGELRIR